MLNATIDYFAPVFFTVCVPCIPCKYEDFDVAHLFLYAVDMSGQATVYSFNCFQKGMNYLPEGSPPFTSVFTTPGTGHTPRHCLGVRSTNVKVVPLLKYNAPNLFPNAIQ